MLLKEYSMSSHLNEKQVYQLLEFSRKDSLVKKFTSDAKRFKDRTAFNEWLDKTPDKFVFSDIKGNLVALLWFSHKKMPINSFEGYDYSLAIRVYGPARGKGLAEKFLKTALDLFKDQFPDKKIWLSTSFNNQAAIKIYEKVGFKKVSEPNENGKILMILH